METARNTEREFDEEVPTRKEWIQRFRFARYVWDTWWPGRDDVTTMREFTEFMTIVMALLE